MKEGVYIKVHDRLNEEDGEAIGKKIQPEKRLRLYGQVNKRIRWMPRR